MAKFLVKIDSARNDEDHDNRYKGSIHSILARLVEDTKGLDNDNLIENIKNNLDMLDGNYFSIKNHPRLWTLSSGFLGRRTGGSTLVIENTQNPDENAYDWLRTQLKAYQKNLGNPLFLSKDKKIIRKKISRALERLEALQKQTGSDYLVHLRDATADKVLKLLTACNLGNESLIEQIKEIKNLKGSQLKTSAACLAYSDKVNTIRNKLLAMIKEKRRVKTDDPDNNLETLEHLSQQLSVVTKAWIDPFYDKPEELTSAERARKIIKMASANISALAGIGAIITFFIFPPASIILGFIGFVSVVPVLDTLFEVAQNYWHGRSPTNQQNLECGLLVPLTFGLIIGAQAFVAIGQAIGTLAPKIADGFITGGTIIANYIFNYADVALNIFASFFGGNDAKKALSISPPKTIDLPTFQKIQLRKLHEEDSQVKSPGLIVSQKADAETKPSKLRFAYFDAEKALKFTKSHADKIAAWDSRLFKGEDAQLYALTEQYHNLPWNAPRNTRKQILQQLKSHITPKENQDSETATAPKNPKIAALREAVENELASLEKASEDIALIKKTK